MRRFVDQLRERNPLPPGAVPVGVGLVINGLAILAMFALASRELSGADYSVLVVLWTLLFAVGNGVMQPLEQEIARAVARRRARNVGAAPVIRRAAAIGLAFTVLLSLLALGLSEFLINELFDGRSVLLVALIIGLFAFCVAHIVRGALSSHGRFRSYGSFFAVEGLSRTLVIGLLVALGVAAVGPYGLTLAIAPLLSACVVWWAERGLTEDGPPAPWHELTVNLGWLLLATGAIALLLNAGTVAVELLATDNQQAAAGVFQNGLVIARLPLFLFQAVLAALLPRLAHQFGVGDAKGFNRSLYYLLAAIGIGAVVATLAAATIGPFVVGIAFGSSEVLSSGDLALLALASCTYMAAIVLMQAVIAAGRHALAAIGAVVGFGTFLAVTALGNDLFLRVELGLVAGSAVTALWMGLVVIVVDKSQPASVELARDEMTERAAAGR